MGNKSLEKLYLCYGVVIPDEFLDKMSHFFLKCLILDDNIFEKNKNDEILKKALFCKLKIEFISE